MSVEIFPELVPRVSVDVTIAGRVDLVPELVPRVRMEVDPVIRWNWARDNLVRARAPLDLETLDGNGNPTPLDAATVIVGVYDRSKDGFALAAASAGATDVSLSNARRLVVGDQVGLVLDDGQIHGATADTIDASTGVVGLSAPIPSSRSLPVGNAVSVLLGPLLAAPGYNLAGAAWDSRDWGYQVTVPARHPGVRRGMAIRVEIVLVEGAVNGFETFDAVVDGPGAAV